MEFYKQKNKVREIASIVLVIAIIAGAIGMAFYAGFIQGTEKPKHITVEGVANPEKGSVEFGQFWEVWNVLKNRYVSEETVNDNQKLLYGAISGLVGALGDPHSVFFPPAEAEKFNEDISGQFQGIGAEIGLNKDGHVSIVAPLEDTPAQHAGLKAGDVVLKINEDSTAGLTVEEAVKKIRGERGTTVTLTIAREGELKEKKFDIVRDYIVIPTTEFKVLDQNGKETEQEGGVAYIRLYNFYEQAPQKFYQAALKTIAANPRGIIIDLRNNPGGYLDASVAIAGWFIDKGEVVVKEAFQDESQTQEFTSRGPGILKSVPVTVLINKGSASASEILAGALKEKIGATIVGETSFGKGTVQELVGLSNDAMVKVTVAHWLTPNGHQIDKNGITPDIAVEEAEKEPESLDQDPIVMAGIQALVEKIASTQ